MAYNRVECQISPDMPLAGQAIKSGANEIPSAMEELFNIVENLGELIEVLKTRLNPIVSPAEEKPKSAWTERAWSAPLASNIAQATSRIAASNLELRDLHNRIQL